MGNLKLFVVGSSSGNPDDWSEFGRRALILAHTLEEALGMVDFSCNGAEVQCDQPTVLYIESPAGGF